MNKLSKIINVLTHKDLSKTLLSQAYSGYLKDSGWIESFKYREPLSADGNPLPWITLPCLDFIGNRINKDMSVFEFGAGNSTLYFAKRVGSIVSVEHNQEWFDKINKNLQSNNSINFCDLTYNGQYCRFIHCIDSKFDLIIIDGRDRVNCIKNCIEGLNDKGCIILDDSERSQYEEGMDYLISKGFKKLDFWGISLGLTYKKCTTIFYKNHNCLGI